MSNRLYELFEKHNDIYLKFEEVIENPRSRRPDLHAFLLLDELMPENRDIVNAAEHDVIYLDIDVDELEKVVSEDHIKELVACGVSFDSEYDCLSMLV